MIVKNIASGSSGNVTLIGDGGHNILIDCGITCKRINEGLKEEGLSLSDIEAVLVTHEHIDHVAAVGVIARKYKIPIYATQGTISGIRSLRSLGDYDSSLFVPIKADVPFSVGDMNVKPLSIFHDSNEPVCFRVESSGKSFAIVTDLGEYNDYLMENLTGLDGILLEANHDVRMLEVGPYPYPLKRRILGKYGHLSNESSGRLLAQILHDDIKYIMLGHLSKENNTVDLARLEVETEIALADNEYRPEDFDIRIAMRDRPSEAFEL